MDRHLVLHQTAHNLWGYSVQIKPKVSGIYRDQCRPDDSGQSILTSAVQLRDKDAFAIHQYHLDVTSLAPEDDVAQDIVNWSNRNS